MKNIIDKKDTVLHWKSHVKNMFDEILQANDDMRCMAIPLKVTFGIMQQLAKECAESGNEKLIGYCCKLALYTFSDPESKDFDRERTEYYVNKT